MLLSPLKHFLEALLQLSEPACARMSMSRLGHCLELLLLSHLLESAYAQMLLVPPKHCLELLLLRLSKSACAQMLLAAPKQCLVLTLCLSWAWRCLPQVQK